MLEDKNDNLQEADGNLKDVSQENTQNTTTEVLETIENVVTLANQEVANTELAVANEASAALTAIDNSNAEESEDETLKDRHNIPLLDYSTMSMDALVLELEKLAEVEKVMSIKDHVEEIKKEFLSKYNHFIEEKKDAYLEENPDTTEDFRYDMPLKRNFDSIYKQIKSKQNTHFKSLQNNLKSNLERRLEIVEEIKNLINPEENIKDTLKHFNELRDQWKNIGPIPRDKYNHVWNNYHFHVENFYDYLHLDRESRDIDFKYNLELKLKIIERVKELVHEEDIIKAFRELQDMHRIWKEDIGPVDREQREEIWNLFSSYTKQMHDKREQLFSAYKEKEHTNLVKKSKIIANINTLAESKVTSHSQWQGLIDKVEALRTAFFSAGKVPAEINENTWAGFKKAVRSFNSNKNNFYKEIKKEQIDNLAKKQALVEKATALKDSEDFAATTPVMKNIQNEWKQIGHVPRKYSDKIWKEFKDTCNHYFDKMKAQRSEENADEIEAFDKKKSYLDTLKEVTLSGKHKEDLDTIKSFIEVWKLFGKVPLTRRHIDGKFNKVLDGLFDQLSLSKKESESIRFSTKLENFANEDNSRKIENEKIYIMRKMQELKSELLQLENNVQFFANAKKDNPLLKDVYKNINKHKEEIKTWKEKLKQLRKLSQD